jgi:ubiquinone/menaquinone biosynthesis C-methylase UbiE
MEFDSNHYYILHRLHHIPQLEEALAKAIGFAKPKGLIFIEEFARETMDEVSATWTFGTHARISLAYCSPIVCASCAIFSSFKKKEKKNTSQSRLS